MSKSMIPQKCVRIFWKDFAHFMTNAKNGTNISRNLIHLKQHLKHLKKPHLQANQNVKAFQPVLQCLLSKGKSDILKKTR